MQTPQQPTLDPHAHAIGVLCVGGDWACAHGDLEALADVARHLASYAREPLHCELLALADACHCNPERATAAWVRLKERAQQSGGLAKQHDDRSCVDDTRVPRHDDC